MPAGTNLISSGGIPFAGSLVSGGPVFVFPTAVSLRDILPSQASGFREKGATHTETIQKQAFNNEVPDEALEPIGLTGAEQ
jgi:hypothetical protein